MRLFVKSLLVMAACANALQVFVSRVGKPTGTGSQSDPVDTLVGSCFDIA